MKIRSFIHLSDVRSTVIRWVHHVGSVSTRNRLIEGSGSTEHGTQFVRLVVLASRSRPCIGVPIDRIRELWNTSCHGSTVCWTLWILAMKLNAGCAAAITGRSYSIRHLQVVQQILDLTHVHLVWVLACESRSTDYFRWVHMWNVSTTIWLITSAVWLGSCDNMFGWVGLMVGVVAAMSWTHWGPLLYNVMELILQCSNIVFSLHRLVNDALVDWNLVVRALTVCDLNASLLGSSVRWSFGQLLDETIWRALAWLWWRSLIRSC